MDRFNRLDKSLSSPGTSESTGTCRRISIRTLKIWATRLEEGSILKTVFLVEPETRTVEEYIAKIATWLNILEVERRREVGGTWHG